MAEDGSVARSWVLVWPEDGGMCGGGSWLQEAACALMLRMPLFIGALCLLGCVW